MCIRDSIWSYITEQGIELPSLYYAHERDVVSRDGMWLAVGEHVSPRCLLYTSRCV